MTIAANLGEAPEYPNEDELIAEIIQANINMVYADKGKPQRAQHPKGHACVTARFEVDRDIPAPLRVGLFAEPRAYDAVIRFSNGAKMDDREDDAHGMAIKLKGVEGETLIGGTGEADLILIDNETFFAGGLNEYAAFNELFGNIVAAKRNEDNELLGAVSGIYLKFIRKHTRGDLLGPAVQFSDQQPTSPLSAIYWSATPYMHGTEHAVKYMARPSPAPTIANLTDGVQSEHGLKSALESGLSKGPAKFDIFAHLQAHPDLHPVEDPTVSWSANGAETVRLATITLNGVGEPDLDSSLSFNPWRTLPAHRPLGAINRVRLKVYQELARKRGAE